jgi:hypothetical protein
MFGRSEKLQGSAITYLRTALRAAIWCAATDLLIQNCLLLRRNHEIQQQAEIR